MQAELLAKKYEEKYKQVAEIASKLTIEEATFREVQVFIFLLQEYWFIAAMPFVAGIYMYFFFFLLLFSYTSNNTQFPPVAALFKCFVV